MTAVLVLLSINEPRVEYVLSCEQVSDQWIYLARWLALKNIAVCTREEYETPDLLKPNNLYCVKGDSVAESFRLFQVLVTSDWEDKENPAPQFVGNIGWLAWTYITDIKPVARDNEDPEKDGDERKIINKLLGVLP
jgi:hypothetical protein